MIVVKFVKSEIIALALPRGCQAGRRRAWLHGGDATASHGVPGRGEPVDPGLPRGAPRRVGTGEREGVSVGA